MATTKFKNDNILEKIAQKNKIQIFRGDSQDVLKDFMKQQSKKTDTIIRICGDNPFIDPEQMTYWLKNLKKNLIMPVITKMIK